MQGLCIRILDQETIIDLCRDKKNVPLYRTIILILIMIMMIIIIMIIIIRPYSNNRNKNDNKFNYINDNNK